MKSKIVPVEDSSSPGNFYCFYRLGFDDKGIQAIRQGSPTILRFGPSGRWARWESQSDGAFFASLPIATHRIESMRKRLMPLPRYIIHLDDMPAVDIQCKSIFRRRWQIAFADGTTWQFHKSLFTAYFHAQTGNSTVVRIKMIAEGRQCYARFSPGQDGPEQFCAILCVMRHHWVWDGF